MKMKVVFAGLAVMAALGGWATAGAADRDDYYGNGYYSHPDGSAAYYYAPDNGYTYYYSPRVRSYAYDSPDRIYTYDYDRDGNRYYRDDDHHYGDADRNYRNEDNEHRYGHWDPYGIDSHDTN
jgi:hypothetical protein